MSQFITTMFPRLGTTSATPSRVCVRRLAQVSKSFQYTNNLTPKGSRHGSLVLPKYNQCLSVQPKVSTYMLSCRHQSTTTGDLAQTPFHGIHVSTGAKMGPFAGFSMPLEYPDQSHSESHHWTRTKCSLFDVSHMVQHELSGPLAEEFLMTITPSSLNGLPEQTSTLSTLLNDDGGIVDDTVITRLGPQKFYFVTNAGCREGDLKYLDENISSFLKSKSAQSDQLNWKIIENSALLALQGPLAQSVLQSLIDDQSQNGGLSTLSFGQSRWLKLKLPDGVKTDEFLVSRTGYTGEDGFEISLRTKDGVIDDIAISVANAMIDDGSQVRWAGLAARDSLRLEAGMCLYGHDIDITTTPPMAALGWIVGSDRRTDNATPKFKGQSVILQQLQSAKTMPLRRVGFLVSKGPAAREGAELLDLESKAVIGKVTSGCPSPTLGGQNIAMGLIKNGYHKRGTKIGIKVRKTILQAEVSKMPFVPNKFYRAGGKEKA